jgi:aconitase A
VKVSVSELREQISKPKSPKSSKKITQIKEDVVETEPINTPEKKTKKIRVNKSPELRASVE